MGRRTASERARPPHRAWTHAAACLFSAARQLDSTRIRRILRLCTPRAPARPTRARAGPDGRADSTALRSATRALPPCAAGLMHSTRAHGAGIAAIAAIRQSPRTVTNGLMMGLMSLLSTRLTSLTVPPFVATTDPQEWTGDPEARTNRVLPCGRKGWTCKACGDTAGYATQHPP